MSLRQCLTPACQAQISVTASTCPHCRLSYNLSFGKNSYQLASDETLREWIAYYQNPKCATTPEYVEPMLQHGYRLASDFMYFRACMSDMLFYHRCWTCNGADVNFVDEGVVFSDPYPEANICNNCGDRMWQFPNIKCKHWDTSSQAIEANKHHLGVINTFARRDYRLGDFPFWYTGTHGVHTNFDRVYRNPNHADYHVTKHFKGDGDASIAIYQRGREWYEETRALYDAPSIAQLRQMCRVDAKDRPF